jgi:hypothetical protein
LSRRSAAERAQGGGPQHRKLCAAPGGRPSRSMAYGSKLSCRCRYHAELPTFRPSRAYGGRWPAQSYRFSGRLGAFWPITDLGRGATSGALDTKRGLSSPTSAFWPCPAAGPCRHVAARCPCQAPRCLNPPGAPSFNANLGAAPFGTIWPFAVMAGHRPSTRPSDSYWKDLNQTPISMCRKLCVDNRGVHRKLCANRGKAASATLRRLSEALRG